MKNSENTLGLVLGGDTKPTQSGKKIINLYKIMKAAVYEN